MWRLAKTSRGPLAPPLRPADGEVMEWSRWDTREGRTIYAASEAVTAYREALAYLTPSPTLGESLDEIASEWQQRNFMTIGSIPQEWRESRNLYTLRLPSEGWFIDIAHAETLAAINRHLNFAERVELSHILGSDRVLTTSIASWLRSEIILDDGSVPHGICYTSKHGSPGECWAVWLRQIDQGRPEASEATQILARDSVDSPAAGNRPLAEAARGFGLHIH